MRTAATMALLTALLAGRVPAAGVQAPGEDPALIGTAVQHMVQLLRANDGMPAGLIRFDDRVLVERRIDHRAYADSVTVYRLSEAREDGRGAAVRARIAAEPGDFETGRVCATASPRSCTLRDAAAVFAAGDPVIRGDTARVLVKAMWLSTSAKQPVHDGVFCVELVRAGDGWRPVATRTLNIS